MFAIPSWACLMRAVCLEDKPCGIAKAREAGQVQHLPCVDEERSRQGCIARELGLTDACTVCCEARLHDIVEEAGQVHE